MTKEYIKLPDMPEMTRAAAKVRTTRKNTNRNFNIKHMQQFHRFFHGSAVPTWELLDDAKKGLVTPKTVRGSLRKVEGELLAATKNGAGIFICPNTVKGDRKSDNVRRINAVFIDSDGTMELPAIKKLKPDLIIETSRDKFHAYWKVRGVKLEQFKPIQQALAKEFGTDPSVCDLARLMRVAGTLHQKSKPRRARIVHINESAEAVPVNRLLKRLGVTLSSGKEDAPDADAGGDVPQPIVSKKLDKSAEMRSALETIPPTDDRRVWLRVGMAIHSALPTEGGFELWSVWSNKSQKYDAADQRKNWNSFTSEGNASKVTVRSLFRLAKEYGWQGLESNTRLPHSSFELVDIFADLIADRLCFVSESRTWHIFVQPCWIADDAKVFQYARSKFELLYKAAKAANDKSAVKELLRRATVTGIKGLLAEAAMSSKLNVSRNVFDQSPHLLAVQNGVLNLRSGKFRLGRPKDRLMLKATAAYDPDAQCPLFEDFLKFVTKGAVDYIRYLQCALGYTLWGHTNLQKLFIVYGESGNGKGTLFHTMEKVLGPFVTALAPNMLSKAYGGNPSGPHPALMAMNGSRMFQCTEGGDRNQFDAAFIKQITGSDMISGRAIMGSQMQFTPVGKLWFSTNTLPEVEKHDKAMWRRIKVLPFDAKIVKRDGEVERQMYAEASGILNWLIKGAVDVGKKGRLPPCAAVKAATRTARRDCDSVSLWVTARCRRNEDGRVQASEAFHSYRKFCGQQSIRPMSNQKFFGALTEKQFRRVRTKEFNAYKGIELNETA